MVGKMKEIVKSKATKMVIVGATIVPILVTKAAHCEDESGAVAAMGTAFGTVKSDMMSAITVIAPIALAVVSAVLIWKFGIKFFKGVAGK